MSHRIAKMSPVQRAFAPILGPVLLFVVALGLVLATFLLVVVLWVLL